MWALILQDKNYNALKGGVINNDLLELGKFIAHLEVSLSSLTEVALQNRHSLDVLFLHQGEPCAALGEQCHFYTNYSEVINEPLSLVKKRIQKHKLTR